MMMDFIKYKRTPMGTVAIYDAGDGHYAVRAYAAIRSMDECMLARTIDEAKGMFVSLCERLNRPMA